MVEVPQVEDEQVHQHYEDYFCADAVFAERGGLTVDEEGLGYSALLILLYGLT